MSIVGRSSVTRLVAALAAASTLAAAPVRASDLTPAQWQADLELMAQQLPEVHKEPFHTVSSEDFHAAVATLHADIPGLAEHQIIVRMAAIVALVNDGHTRLTGWWGSPRWGFRWYPVLLYAFAEGLYVRQAHPDFAHLAGARVVSINGHSVEEADEMVGRAVAADNRYGKLADTPRAMAVPEILHAMGVVDDMDHPRFEFEKDGTRTTVDLPAMRGPRPQIGYGFVAASEAWADARNTAMDPPLWMKHLDRPLWFEYLPEHKLVYVQQNQILDSPRNAVGDFYAEVFDFVDNNDVEKFVLDLRLNGGGNNYRNRPVITGLIAARKINQTGRLYTIIGRRTFSAAQNLINEIEKYTEATFVGEPTGERVNFFGDTKPIQLPNSGLVVRASWLWWQNHDPRDSRRWTSPRIAAVPSFADYRNNVDAALEAILHTDQLFSADQLLDQLRGAGLEAGVSYAREHREAPTSQFVNMEAEINQIGYETMARGDRHLAIDVFRVNVALYPDSWNVYDSLGEALLDAGQRDEALANYRKSLELRPDSPSGLQAIAEIEHAKR